MSKILVVDDEKDVTETLLHSLTRRGYEVETANTGEDGIKKAQKSKFDIVLLDIKLPGIEGIEVLEEIKKIDPEVEVIMITGHGSIDTAIDTMKKGAYDYVEKPFNSEKIAILMEKALEKHRLTETVALYEISKAIFSTIEMDGLLKIIVDLAMKTLRADDASIMLFDESGKLFIAISYGLDEQVKKETRLALGERIAGWVAESNQPIILINGLTNDTRFSDIRGREDIKSAMVIPLIKKDKVLGILSVNRIKLSENFTKVDLYKSNIFVSLVSLALDNANLYNNLLKVQNELRLAKENLEIKVKERTLELTQTNDNLNRVTEELKFANKAKSEFLANMSHELRTPLNSIIGFAEILFDENIGSFNDKQKEFLNYILVSGKHLHTLINEVLDLAKVEAGKMDLALSVFPLKSLIENVTILIKEMAIKKNITISLEISENIGYVEADERKTKQILFNLLSNAVKFTLAHGKIGIRARKNDSEIEVAVWDTGVGIASEDLGRMFEYFHRIDTPYSRAVEGSGLGLAYSKRLVELHGGTIRIESEGLNKGTTVKFTLPCKR